MKKIVSIIALLVILGFGVFGVTAMYNTDKNEPKDKIDVVGLYQDPSSYTIEENDKVADIIVKTDLEQTNAENVVAAVVFDYRGFDTMGEAFVLLTAITGAYVILKSSVQKKGSKSDEK